MKWMEEDDDVEEEDVEEGDRPQSRDIISCEPAQSKRAWTFHKSHFVPKFTGKMPDPNPGTSFRASLRSRNVHGHFTRAILRGHLQGRNRTRMRTP